MSQVVSVVDFKLLAPHCCGFETCQRLEILLYDVAIHSAYGMLMIMPHFKEEGVYCFEHVGRSVYLSVDKPCLINN